MSSKIHNENEEEILDKLARVIVAKYGMGTASIFLLETLKPMAYVGGEFGRFLLAPILALSGPSIESMINQHISILEERENVEKLLKKIEVLMKKEDDERKSKKIKKESSIKKKFYTRIFGKKKLG